MAIILNVLTPTAFNDLFGIAIFGGIFVWIMIFVTFLRFQTKSKGWTLSFRAPLFPVVPIVGAVLLAAILITMLTSSDWSYAWYYGVPFIVRASSLLRGVGQKNRRTGSCQRERTVGGTHLGIT